MTEIAAVLLVFGAAYCVTGYAIGIPLLFVGIILFMLNGKSYGGNHDYW